MLPWLAAVAVTLGVASALLQTESGFALLGYVWGKVRGGYTVSERVDMYAEAVQSRLAGRFSAAGLPYPPAQLAYVAFKDRRIMEIHGRSGEAAPWQHVITYSILGMSGGLGPKLREGDMQVPEGVYHAEFLNPNSRFHLSIRLNYPNAYDVAQAREDGRNNLGSDIMIHGSTASIGCLAMGNQAAEDLFILAALVGKENVSIIVAPTDFRRSRVDDSMGEHPGLNDLYQEISLALEPFP